MGRRHAIAFSALMAACAAAGGAARARAPGTPALALDHMPTVVADVEAAAADYVRLGFSLKPGRAHANGLRNRHVKFPDGSGIELIEPAGGARDALSARYAEALAHGEGPVYLALRVVDASVLPSALRVAGIRYRTAAGAVEIEDPELSALFFGGDNRSPTDRPVHFAHANGASAMTGVWLALGERPRARLARLLEALGAKRRQTLVPLGPGVRADAFVLANGRIVLLPERYRPHAGCALVGAEFRVRRNAQVDPCASHPPQPLATGKTADCLLPPASTHGLWLRFES